MFKLFLIWVGSWCWFFHVCIHIMLFLKKFMFYASWYHLDISSYFSIPPQYIKPHFSSFCLLDTNVNLSKSSSTHPSIPPNKLKSSCMHFILFVMFCIFFIPFVSIASCFSCRSMVPCSPHSLYVSFPSISGQVFGFLCPLTIMWKRGRNLGFECHSSRGVIDLGRELGGELVWYTLILIYFEICIFVLCSCAMIEIFLLFIPLALWIKVFLSLFI